MSKKSNKSKSRKYSRKALKVVNEIQKEYPNGISDVSKIDKYKRAWLQSKIQRLRECLKNVLFPSKPKWWESLRLSRNKTAHLEEDFTDKTFTKLCGCLFSSIDKIRKDLQMTSFVVTLNCVY